ncbi:GSCOCG00012172001-RA-CDS [Cotesia congregata]|nr:GSCOCG00012172001-RA-CDS [Cotesia congregata]
MEHAKKMVLIPYEDIDKLKSGAKNFEQVLTALSTQYLPTSQTPGDPLSRLDAELSKTLNESSSNISDNNKLKQYSELLRRYLFFKNKSHEGNSTVEKIENNEVIPDTADFYAINRDPEISNISINNSIAEQNKSYKVSDIVNGVPKTYQTAAENILRYIESVDNGERLKWDNKGSVTLDDRKIPGANIVDLINDAVRHRKTVKATGRDFFASFSQEINTPREFVGNSSFWNKSLKSIKKLPINTSTPKRHMRSNDSSGNSQNFLSLTNNTLQNGGNKKQLYKNSFKWLRL